MIGLALTVWLFGCVVHTLVAIKLRAERDRLAWALIAFWPLTTPCLLVSEGVTRLLRPRSSPALVGAHGYRDQPRCPTCGQRVLGDTPERLPEREPLPAPLFETMVRVAETVVRVGAELRRK